MDKQFWRFCREPLAVLILSICVTMPFWPELWQGAGLVGGDAVGYFLPQKTYLADNLDKGDIPLWNNLVGHGYSFVGDSQSAVWYPTTLLLYATMDINSAINVTFLLHYSLAFSIAWFCARQSGLRLIGSSLAALVFTYGYFPSRISVEWAITTGAYVPLGWGCLEAWLRTGRRKWLALLVMGLTCQLLAGHFHNAFITHVWLALAAVLRTTVARRETDSVRLPAWKTLVVLAFCQIWAFPLAAIQLWPTWEARQFSERNVLPIPNIDYGRIPGWYLKQLIIPWTTYGEDPNVRGGPETNIVSAQLYMGIIPMLFAANGLWAALRRRRQTMLVQAALSGVALAFAVGWLTPAYKYLPGFGWFTGSGRYAIVFALGTALLAGAGLDNIAARFRLASVRLARRNTKLSRKRVRGVRRKLHVLTLTVMVVTFVDLRYIGRSVAFSIPIQDAPLNYRDSSMLRKILQSFPGEPRLLAPHHNIVSALGVGVLPGYFGLLPAHYKHEENRIPGDWPVDMPPGPGQLNWLRDAGVTHLLFTDQNALRQWQQEMISDEPQMLFLRDRFINVTFSHQDRFFILPITHSRGRIAWTEHSKTNTAKLTTYEPDVVEATVNSERGGVVVLTDFAYPGWQLAVDGDPVNEILVDNMYRGVKVDGGEHKLQWRYEPMSVFGGSAISVLALIAAAMVYIGLGQTSRQT